MMEDGTVRGGPAGTTRRGFLVAVACGMAGCSTGDSTGRPTATGNPAVGAITPAGDLSLSSPAFEDGGRIPEEYARANRNVNPPLRIDGVPGNAESLVLIFEDPDAPGRDGIAFLHWLVWNVPPDRREIPKGWNPSTAVEGVNDFGNRGYGGPAPPSEHTYRFELYALDRTLDLPRSADRTRVGEAMRGHVLATAVLEGRYGP